MTYRYLDANGPAAAPHRYELTLTVYNSCGAAAIRPAALIGIYEQGTGNQVALTTTNYANVTYGNLYIPQTSIGSCTTPYVPPGCTITGASQAYQLQKFVGIVNLPANAQGYYALWTDGNRNGGITNIASPSDNEYMTLYSTLAPPAWPNSSPVFVSQAVANICINDTTTLLNNAVDADGDRLEYTLAQPYGYNSTAPPFSFLPTPTPTPYAAAQYTATTPLGTGAGNYASINANTGIAKYRTTAALNSKYVVAIDVKEYRLIGGTEQLIGVTRRDLQLVVVSCPNTIAPVLSTAFASSPTPRTYTLEAGSTLRIPISATQADGHPLALTLSSVLLDGAGGHDATFAGSQGTLVAGNPAGSASVAAAASPIMGTFVYTAGCTDARTAPYDVTLTVKDEGCAGKTVGDVLRITVVKPTGPTAIIGNQAVCGLNTVQSYTASGGTAAGVQWTATGGTIVGSSTANPVQVNWPAAGTGTLVAQGVTQSGCPIGQATTTVTVSPAPALTVTGNQTICQGSSTTLAVSGGTAPYTLTGGATPVSGAGPFVLSPTQTTTYTITSAGSGSGCATTGQVTVTVNPLPAANAGAAVAICTGGTAQLGASPVAGLAYSWSPATGLSSATVANPTVTLTNATGAATTQTYTLTVTNSATNCVNTSTVTVTVNPPLVVNAGSDVAICSGSSAQLGAAPVAGYTYAWSPATGLSNSSIANPTVMLTNATGAPITQTYTLTTTNTGGCVSTGAVAVTVNPAPTANAGAAVAFCTGGSAQLGAPAVAGYTYSWSPTTGLSSATVANPTVTLTNTTSAPITQTYTLTVTGPGSCTAASTVVVTVNPLLTVVPGTAVAFCSGNSAVLGAAPIAGYTYAWSPAAGLSSSTVANPTVTLTNATSAAITQTYTLTATNAATGCSGTAAVVVTVSPLPVAAPGTAVAFCSGESGQLGAAPVAGLTYSWSPATGLSNASLANPTVTLTNATGAAISQTYTLTTTNVTGCASTGTVAVTVHPLPVANAGSAIAFCTGGSGQLGAAPVAGYTYAWSPTTGLSSSTAANPTVTLTTTTSAPVTQTYTLTVTSATGCTSTGTVVVTVNPLPVANAGTAVTNCSGGTSQLGAAAVAGLTYSWSPATGLSSATVANPTVTLTNTNSVPTTQTYTLTVSNAATACASTSTVAVTVLPALQPGAIGADQTVCAGTVPAPLASKAAASGGSGTYDYQWQSSLNNSSWTAIAGATNPDYAPGAVAVTTCFRRQATAGTCGLAYSNVVTIRAQALLLPAVALPTLPAQCAGSAFTFTPVPSNAGPAPTYQWFLNGVALGSGPAYTSSTLADGDVIRVLMTPSAGFCATGTAVAATRVSLTPVPNPTLTIKLQTALPVCAGTPISFSLDQATNLGARPQYQWLIDGVAMAGATSATFTCATLRDGQAVALLVRTTTACGQPATATSAAIPVRVNQPVRVSAGPDKTIMEGESVVLEGTADGSYPVVWTPAAALTFAGSDQLRPTAAPTVTTTYTLAAGAGYCTNQSQVTVTVTPRVRIPNAFTPNGDNDDDTWQIGNIDAYPNSHVLVFNRWGGKLFEASGYNRSIEWNGTANGEPLPLGTYYYVVTLGNGKSYSGPLTIVR